MKRLLVCLAPVLFLAACAPGPDLLDENGNPVRQVYRIGPGEAGDVQYRMLDAVNAVRQSEDLAPLELDPRLNAAAATHARDMAVQNRPWHFGSDGSSPLDRVARAGYQGRFLGETISESYETEIETLAAWMGEPNTRRVLIDPEATEMGFQWFQESGGKIWWTLVTGTPGGGGGATGGDPVLVGPEITG